ncbi:S8 family serine peptidase [Lentilactobacillus hilgardii]|uniref:S8 family serine peptidase n=1 Tax=Lentilactobacillus hilgardii TaxID=1588 RepID=UPI0021C4194A|nr:S8 family serine peptidase [Lentilactobacillus hilgardii]
MNDLVKRLCIKKGFIGVFVSAGILLTLGLLIGFSSPVGAGRVSIDLPVYAKGRNENQAAIDKGNVPKLWQSGNRGQGMVVAVIDTGIQPHKDFRLTSPGTAKISRADAQRMIAQKGYGRYVNSKIPFAYNYTSNSNQATEPDDVSGFHGQHVAGIIAANGRYTKKQHEYVVGVAPEAQLLDLRVSDMIDDENKNDVARAIHDAVDLGANVISISLGISLPNQSFTDEEQAAVQYAVNHGVFVSLAGGNYGNSASIFTNNPLANTNGINTAYQEANSGTLADPAVSANSMTVAAENSLKGSQNEMASFSSWGPTPDYTLKPDISAPGMGITSTWQNNTYAMLEGTSMATPFVSGAAALVIQKLKQSQPDLSGSQLVSQTKNMLMNSATPMKDVNYHGNIVSPRRQGAGQINVTAAANLKATVQDPATGIGSVSLGQISSSRSFKVELSNHGSVPINYAVDNDGGPMTQIRDQKRDGQVHDISLTGASLTSDQSNIVIDPGQRKTLTLSLAISPTVKPNQVVEGYLHFKADQPGQSLSMPYLAYYGDTTKEQVIDSPAFMPNSVFHGGYLMDENNTPLGISDRVSLSAYVNNHDNKTNWRKVASYIHPARVAFSPNGDHHQDSVTPFVFAKQSLANVKAQIVNDQGNVIRVIDQETDTDKSIANDSGNLDLSTSFSMRQNPKALQWDGRYIDQSTGKSIVVPNGRYHYQLVTTNYNDGADQQQLASYPVEVDTRAPQATAVTYNRKTGRLTGQFNDHGAGFTGISRGILSTNGHQFGIKLTKKAALTGQFSDRLTSIVKQMLMNHQANLTLTDIAGNSTKVAVHRKLSGLVTKKANVSFDRAPQLKWFKYGTGKNASSSYLEISNKKVFTLYARVPKGVPALNAYAKDTGTNKVVKGRLNPKTGVVAFTCHFSQTGYETIQGWSQVPQKKFGAYLKSPSTLIVVSQLPKAPLIAKLKKTTPKLISNAQAQKKTKSIFGSPIPNGHKTSQLTYRRAPSKGIKFFQLHDNASTFLNAANSATIYDLQTHQLTINGQVSSPNKQRLVILATPDETDPANRVRISKNGTFKFKVPFNPTEQRGVGYNLYTKTILRNGQSKVQKQRGILEIYLDVVKPSLAVSENVENNRIRLTGTVNDNVSGVKLDVNGNNLFSQQKDAGFNSHDQNQPLNPYPDYQINQSYDLTPGRNTFTVKAIDQVGNVTTKRFVANGQG